MRLFESTFLNVLLALAVPVVWGILSAWVFDLFRARKARRNAKRIVERIQEPRP